MFSHPNLVKLLGYCSEGGRLFLVHEYIPKRNFLDIIRRKYYSLDLCQKIDLYLLEVNQNPDSSCISFFLSELGINRSITFFMRLIVFVFLFGY